MKTEMELFDIKKRNEKMFQEIMEQCHYLYVVADIEMPETKWELKQGTEQFVLIVDISSWGEPNQDEQYCTHVMNYNWPRTIDDIEDHSADAINSNICKINNLFYCLQNKKLWICLPFDFFWYETMTTLHISTFDTEQNIPCFTSLNGNTPEELLIKHFGFPETFTLQECLQEIELHNTTLVISIISIHEKQQEILFHC